MNLDQVTSNELGSKTLTQLRDIAKEIGIKSVSKYKKNELIELINENIKKQEPVEVKTNICRSRACCAVPLRRFKIRSTPTE